MANYYEILGVDKNASEEDIKRAHKKLVLKWHPDRWVNGTDEEKKTAEEKIKEINEAYSVLSDKQKRQNYDMFGSAEGMPGPGGFGYDDDSDPFASFFGRRHRRVEKGEDAVAYVDITFNESYTGVKNKTAYINKKVKCDHCNGTGSEDGKEHKCPHCNGTGQYVQSQRNQNAFFQTITQCPYCHGTGKETTKACKECHGSGFKTVTEPTTIEVPAGVFDGAELVIPGAGSMPVSGNGMPGDLHVIFRVSEDQNYQREGFDLIYTLYLTLLEAWDGCEKNVYLPDGKKVMAKVNKGSKDGDTIIKYGQGFEDPRGTGHRGNFVIVIKYKVPENITKEQRELIKKFYELEK